MTHMFDSDEMDEAERIDARTIERLIAAYTQLADEVAAHRAICPLHGG